MTATAAPARPVPVRRERVPVLLSFLRLLRIEMRRSPMPLILPVIAALFWFDSYRSSTSQAPLFPLVTFWNMGQGHTIIDFGPFAAGMAAWIGSRDGRRGTADLVTATPRPRWVARLASWAATATWAVGAYLVFVGVMFAVYAHRGVQGEPPWWWVGVGATAVAAFTAAGFTAGALIPNRFVAPLAAFAGFLLMMLSSQIGFRDRSGWALILPTNSNGNFQQDSGIFYHYLPDLPIARMIFLAGIAVAALGVAALPAAAGGRRLRMAAAAVTAAGLAATGTAVGLATTARLSPHGIVIPALHDAASDNLIDYTPVCAGSGFRVCLNPAYKSYLTDTTAALTKVAGEVAGLPGAPVRAVQTPASYNAADAMLFGSTNGQSGQPMTIGGNPPVLSVPLGAYFFLPGPTGFSNRPTPVITFDQSVWLLFIQAFVGVGKGQGTPAQQAVRAALLQGIGVPFAAQPGLMTNVYLSTGHYVPPSGPIHAAASRLAALPEAARHAWLATHLTALRAGRLTLKQVP
jgi:hypothetical protein